jgi:hypothetical protein
MFRIDHKFMSVGPTGEGSKADASAIWFSDARDMSVAAMSLPGDERTHLTLVGNVRNGAAL